MRKLKIIFILGLWVAILPYLGFPSFLKNLLLSLSGLAIFGVSFTFYRSLAKEKEIPMPVSDNFSENKNNLNES